MMDPVPVPVILPDGTEILGMMLAADTLELDGRGEDLRLEDIIVVDGARRPVYGRRINFEPLRDMGPEEGCDVHVRIRLGPPVASSEP